MVQAEYFFDLSHGFLLSGQDRTSPLKGGRIRPVLLDIHRSFAENDHSGYSDQDSGYFDQDSESFPFSGRITSESLVALNQNGWSD